MPDLKLIPTQISQKRKEIMIDECHKMLVQLKNI